MLFSVEKWFEWSKIGLVNTKNGNCSPAVTEKIMKGKR